MRDMFDDADSDGELYFGEDSISKSDLGLSPLEAKEHKRANSKTHNSGRSNKNKYIKSINDMVKKLPKEKVITISQGRELLATNDQTISSNRLSARQSRERKKVYIDLMEAKLAQLEEEKRALDKQLQQAKDNLLKASTLAQQTAGGFTAGRQLIIRKLSQLQSKQCEGPQKQRNEQQMNMTLDSLRYRISATGKERIAILNEHLKQISSNYFPALTRYLMWTACESSHFFNEDPTSQSQPWFRDILTSVALTPEQLSYIRSNKHLLSTSKEEVDQHFTNIDRFKEQLSQLSERSDEVLDVLRGVMTGGQCARVVLFVDSNRCRTEIDRLGELEREAGVTTLKKVKRTAE